MLFHLIEIFDVKNEGIDKNGNPIYKKINSLKISAQRIDFDNNTKALLFDKVQTLGHRYLIWDNLYNNQRYLEVDNKTYDIYSTKKNIRETLKIELWTRRENNNECY